MLTAKQAAYANLRIAGNDPSAAYRGAYDVKSMSAKAISVEANRLENHPAIALVVLQGRQAATEKAIITETWWLERVRAEAENPKGNRVGALNLAAKFLGIGEPEREPVEPANLTDFLNAAKDRLRVVGNG